MANKQARILTRGLLACKVVESAIFAMGDRLPLAVTHEHPGSREGQGVLAADDSGVATLWDPHGDGISPHYAHEALVQAPHLVAALRALLAERDDLHAALAAYDAAVAENRAHDSRVQRETPPPTWNERRGVLLNDVNRTRFYLDREQGSLNDFTRMGADPVIIADQKAEVDRRRTAWQAAMQRYKDERPADAEPQP